MTIAHYPTATPATHKPLLIAKWLLLIGIVAASVWAGRAARVWQFNVTEPTHFFSDVQRNWYWGQYTWANIHDRGGSYFDTYDRQGIQDRNAQPYTDYAPLRMAVFTLWAATNQTAFPTHQWLPSRAFHAFYVDFNTAMESIGALGAFMLVRAVVRRSRFVETAEEPWWTFTGSAQGLAAALILWFNPAMWLSAHSWPGGDSWIIPPFLWAVYFSVRKCWFTAGVVLAIGALFKGQQFFIALVFMLWPLLQGKPMSTVRFIGGLIAMFGLSTVGWTLTFVDETFVRHVSWPAVTYVVCLIMCAIALPLLIPRVQRRFANRRYARPAVYGGVVLICMLALLWPLLMIGRPFPRPEVAIVLSPAMLRLLVVGMCVVATMAVLFVRPRWSIAAAVSLAGAGALMSMPLFGTCFAWFDAGYLFGPSHWDVMVMGLTSNLPGILAVRYGWNVPEKLSETLTTLCVARYSIDLTMRIFLAGSFAVLLVLSAIGISIQDRRNSTRLLIAVCTPWLLFFCIPAQIHERYLLFGAAIAAICIGHSVGMALLGIFLSAVSWIMTMHVLNEDSAHYEAWNHHLAKMYPQLFATDNQFAQSLQRFLDGTHPDIGWAVLLATAIFLYLSMTPLWKSRRPAAIQLQSTETLPIVARQTNDPIISPSHRLLPSTESMPLA